MVPQLVYRTVTAYSVELRQIIRIWSKVDTIETAISLAILLSAEGFTHNGKQYCLACARQDSNDALLSVHDIGNSQHWCSRCEYWVTIPSDCDF